MPPAASAFSRLEISDRRSPTRNGARKPDGSGPRRGSPETRRCCPGWCQRRRRDRRLRPGAGLAPARRWFRKSPCRSGWMDPGPRYTSAAITNARGGRWPRPSPGLTSCSRTWSRTCLTSCGFSTSMSPGTGWPVDQDCLVKIPPAGRDHGACLSIRLLGDDNGRTVKEGNVRRKDRHGNATFPRQRGQLHCR